ncbi:MAG: MFS transporter [Pseudomonadota bacterium]
MQNSAARVLQQPNYIPDDAPRDETMCDATRSKYHYWRWRIMYTTIFGYATFYLVRGNFAMAMPTLENEFGYTTFQLGIIVSIFYWTYGIGKFVNGYFSDRSNARYFMTAGLVGSATVNYFMGLGSSLIFFGFFWTINACFQSMAWPPIARLLTHWFAPKELGTKWGFWNCSHQIGGALIFIFSGYVIQWISWQAVFYIPAIIATIMSLFLFNRLRDTPRSLGFPPVEVYKGLPTPKATEEDDLPQRELIRRVLENKLLWYVCIANMFLYLVRMGVFTWAPWFLQERGSSIIMSGWQAAAFELAGLGGGVCAGFVSDRLFHGRRGPVGFIYMLGLIVALFCLWILPAGYASIDALILFAIGFLVYGPQVMVGVAAADFASKKAAGMATGLTGTFGYLGAGLSGIGIGLIMPHWGWSGSFLFFIFSAIAGAFFFALTWHSRAKSLDHQ